MLMENLVLCSASLIPELAVSLKIEKDRSSVSPAGTVIAPVSIPITAFGDISAEKVSRTVTFSPQSSTFRAFKDLHTANLVTVNSIRPMFTKIIDGRNGLCFVHVLSNF